MGKTKLIVAGILAVGLLVGGSVVAYAGDGSNAAVVTKDVGCGMPDAISGLGTDLLTLETIDVETSSGISKLSCHFDIPEGFEPAKAMKMTGFLCSTYGGITTDSQFVASPGGKAVLTCQIKKP